MNYYIRFGFAPTDMPFPHPSQLQARITVLGEEEGEYQIAWKENQFYLLDERPLLRNGALRQALKRLNQFRGHWRSEPKTPVVIQHQGYYCGHGKYASKCTTTITWNGLRWDSSNSRYYPDTNTSVESHLAMIPKSARIEYSEPGLSLQTHFTVTLQAWQSTQPVAHLQ